MKLIHGVSSTGDVPVDVLAWLTVNGMRSEKLQFLQLCHQNLTNVFRKVRPSPPRMCTSAASAQPCCSVRLVSSRDTWIGGRDVNQIFVASCTFWIPGSV